jgi:peroxiredoxin
MAFCRGWSGLLLVVAGCAGAREPPPRASFAALEREMEVSVGAPVEPGEPPLDTTRTVRGWLGVELVASAPEQPGVTVRDVIRNSPAEHAGLRPGDVILRVAGEAVNEADDVVRLVGNNPAGARLGVSFARGNESRMLQVRLGPAPDDDGVMRMRYVGAPAPALLDLQSVQGSVEPTKNALQGKVVVLEFWASWCSVCRFLVPKMNEWHDRFAMQGVQVLGVTTEPVVSAAQAASQLGMGYAVASDGSGKTTEAYRANALPTLFVLDRRGIVRGVTVGYSSERIAGLQELIARLVAEP